MHDARLTFPSFLRLMYSYCSTTNAAIWSSVTNMLERWVVHHPKDWDDMENINLVSKLHVCICAVVRCVLKSPLRGFWRT